MLLIFNPHKLNSGFSFSWTFYVLVNQGQKSRTFHEAWELWTGRHRDTGTATGIDVPASILTTERRIFSTLCTGLHRSELAS